ncbi:hypothetical protein D3C76_1448690 [compost metagenome]
MILLDSEGLIHSQSVLRLEWEGEYVMQIKRVESFERADALKLVLNTFMQYEAPVIATRNQGNHIALFFVDTAPEQITDGMQFTPMRYMK